MTTNDDASTNGGVRPAFPDNPRGDTTTLERTIVMGRARRLSHPEDAYILPPEFGVEDVMGWLWEGWDPISTVPYERGLGVVRRHRVTGELVAYFCSDISATGASDSWPWELLRKAVDHDVYCFIADNAPSAPDLTSLYTRIAEESHKHLYCQVDVDEIDLFAVGAARAVVALGGPEVEAARMLSALTYPALNNVVGTADEVDAHRVIRTALIHKAHDIEHTQYGDCYLCQTVTHFIHEDPVPPTHDQDQLVDLIYADWWDPEAKRLVSGWEAFVYEQLANAVHHKITTTEPVLANAVNLLAGLPRTHLDAYLDVWEDPFTTAKQAFRDAIALTTGADQIKILALTTGADQIKILALTTGEARIRKDVTASHVLLAAVRDPAGRLRMTHFTYKADTRDNPWDLCNRMGHLTHALFNLDPIAINHAEAPEKRRLYKSEAIDAVAPKSLWDRFAAALDPYLRTATPTSD